MPSTIYANINLSVGGVSISGNVSATGDGQISVNPTLAVGWAGSLTTRTDDNTGVVTATEAGHTIADSDVCDVFWEGGIRYGMTADVTGTAITLDGGAGDNLPIATTEVVVCKRTVVNCAFDGDDLQMLGMQAPYRAHVDFRDSGDASLYAAELVAGVPQAWFASFPITGNAVATIHMSNGDSAYANEPKVCGLYDATT